jgi:hypothetical protein
MKKNITAIIFLLATLSIYSQKKGENVEPWFENYERTPFQQGRDGSILLRITNKGKSVDDCIEKAKQQAVYSLIFKGYTEANNIPKADPISPDGESLYNEKIDFFKEFFTNTSLYRSYVPKTDLDPKNPASEIDRKTWEVTTIVTIEVNRLRSDLEKQKIIKSLVDFGFTPSVLVVPSDKWMSDNGYITKDETYRYADAIIDDKIYKALASIESKYNKPAGPFKIMDIKSKKDDIRLEEAKNNAREKAKQESSAELYARVVAADIWVKVDIDDKNSGELIVTLNGIDPYTQTKAITGTPLRKTTHGNDVFQLMMNSINGASDEMRTKIFTYLQGIVNSGIEGEILISQLENLDFNLNTMFNYNDSDMTLADLIVLIVSSVSMPDTTQPGTGTDFRLPIPTKIPVFTEAKDFNGKIINKKNSFRDAANKTRDILSKQFGILSTVESIGLGKVEIVISGKK